ncbi:MAG: site-specific integrase [Methylotenera sp.]
MNNKGHGTITKRVGVKSTSYQAKVKVEGNYYSQTFPTSKEATAFIQDIQSRIRKGEQVDYTKIKKTHLSQIFNEYTEHHDTLPRLKKKRIEKLIVELGNVPLERFTSNGFETYLKHKRNVDISIPAKGKDSTELKKTYAAGTIRKYYYDIRTVLKWHSKKYDYVFNTKPFDDNPAPGAWDNPRDRRLTDAEINTLLVSCNRMYANKEALKAVINFQRYSAMRIGETLKMKWSDIRLDEEEPSASYIFVPKENQKTRNKKSCKDRYVPMRPDLHQLIKEKILNFNKTSDLVFPYWKDPTLLSSRFKLVCENSGIVNFRIHDLRHEAISWFFENSPLTDIEISNISGHVEMDTLKRYANLRPSKTGAKLWGKV